MLLFTKSPCAVRLPKLLFSPIRTSHSQVLTNSTRILDPCGKGLMRSRLPSDDG